MNSGVLQRIRNLKTQNASALAETLRSLKGVPFSECRLADEWLRQLSNDEALYDDGWYDPPPRGVIVLFGQKNDGYARVGAPSFRSEPYWPTADRHCESEDVLLVYASPVCRQTSLMGDFGLSLYRGNDASMREHFENVLKASLEIASMAREGMAFSELYHVAMTHVGRYGYANLIESHTDSAGTNIGHTIPLSYTSDDTFKKIDTASDFASLRKMLSEGRSFINAKESQTIESNMAFTIEPRLSAPGLPRIFYHLTVIMDQGVPTVCHGFGPVFEAFDMNYLTKLLPGL